MLINLPKEITIPGPVVIYCAGVLLNACIEAWFGKIKAGWKNGPLSLRKSPFLIIRRFPMLHTLVASVAFPVRWSSLVATMLLSRIFSGRKQDVKANANPSCNICNDTGVVPLKSAFLPTSRCICRIEAVGRAVGEQVFGSPRPGDCGYHRVATKRK